MHRLKASGEGWDQFYPTRLAVTRAADRTPECSPVPVPEKNTAHDILRVDLPARPSDGSADLVLGRLLLILVGYQHDGLEPCNQSSSSRGPSTFFIRLASCCSVLQIPPRAAVVVNSNRPPKTPSSPLPRRSPGRAPWPVYHFLPGSSLNA